jgi:uncharacterized protein involved in exopolysaccharide biosynthesis
MIDSSLLDTYYAELEDQRYNMQAHRRFGATHEEVVTTEKRIAWLRRQIDALSGKTKAAE